MVDFLKIKKLSGSHEHESDEVMILKKKLQLKTEALTVLSQELNQCQMQREEMQKQFWDLKRQINQYNELRQFNLNEDISLTEVLEQNKCLKLQVETLRLKLNDAQRNIKTLSHQSSNSLLEIPMIPATHEKEEMIEQLEKLNVKCSQLENDLKNILDEKHELEIERDAYKCKSYRLNHELSKALYVKTLSKPIDIDSLINENRYLQERLQQLLEEKEAARQSLSKYKGMLDSKKTKSTIKLDGNGTAGKIMTYKQVEDFLKQEVNIPPQKSTAALSDLKCLCVALLEALNDKILALAHQKKANKILANRLFELDSIVPSPSTKLLEGYTVKTGQDQDEDLDIEKHIEMNGKENNITQPVNEKQTSPQSLLTLDLPQNLEELVQKALTNLKNNT